MIRFLITSAVLAAAIAAAASMMGLDMHAIIILVGLGLVIRILVSGGSPSGQQGQGGGRASAADTYGSDFHGTSAGYHTSGHGSSNCGSIGAGFDCGGGS